MGCVRRKHGDDNGGGNGDGNDGEGIAVAKARQRQLTAKAVVKEMPMGRKDDGGSKDDQWRW